MVIYKITNTVNNKCYIGLTIQKLRTRLSQHISSAKEFRNSVLSKAIRKYGAENFKIEEIDTANDLNDLAKKEYENVIKHNSLIPNGYNMKDGGQMGGNGGANKGLKWSKEAKERHKIAMKNRNLIPWNKGTKGLTKSNKTSFKKGDQVGIKNSFYGKKHTIEAKSKISKKQNKRSIKCLNDGRIFESISEAKRVLNLDLGNLAKVLKGTQKHINGYKFIYWNKEI